MTSSQNHKRAVPRRFNFVQVQDTFLLVLHNAILCQTLNTNVGNELYKNAEQFLSGVN